MNAYWTSARLWVHSRLLARFTEEQRAMLVLSQVMALIWWGIALALYLTQDLIPIWQDQSLTFMHVIDHLGNPYQDRTFVNPVWTVAFLAPLGLLPLPAAALIQIIILFGAIAGFIIKVGGTVQTARLVFFSFIAFHTSVELSIEWIIALALVVPVQWCMPLLLTKPQVALGYLLHSDLKTLMRSGFIMFPVLAITFLIWGFWPATWYRQIGFVSGQTFNIAIASRMPRAMAYLLGLPFVVWTIRKRDPALGIIAWLFYTPYLTFYSMLIPYTCLALRWELLAKIIFFATWIIYSGALLLGLILTYA